MLKKQITAYLPNEVGALARMAAILGRAKVNIEAISVVENTDTGAVRMVVSVLGPASKALTRHGIAFTVQDVEVLPLENEPGALAVAAARLAKAGVSIHYVYGSVCHCGGDCKCQLVVAADDLRKVRMILG